MLLVFSWATFKSRGFFFALDHTPVVRGNIVSDAKSNTVLLFKTTNRLHSGGQCFITDVVPDLIGQHAYWNPWCPNDDFFLNEF